MKIHVRQFDNELIILDVPENNKIYHFWKVKIVIKWKFKYFFCRKYQGF